MIHHASGPVTACGRSVCHMPAGQVYNGDARRFTAQSDACEECLGSVEKALTGERELDPTAVQMMNWAMQLAPLVYKDFAAPDQCAKRSVQLVKSMLMEIYNEGTSDDS